MTPEMRKFIELLESQLGYSEKAGAYTKFGDWYGDNIEFDADYSVAPWCDMFLAWAATKLGYEEWMGQFAWTVAHAKWFKKQDAWGTKPEPGAFVFFDWHGSDSINRIDHIGVVTKVSGGRIHTIEGNIDGGVAKRKVRDTSKVVGYGYPWKIKERLDAEAAEQAALESEAGLGTQDGTGLAVLVPHVELGEQPKVPPTTRTGKSGKSGQARQKKAEAPAKASKPAATQQAKPAPQAEAAPSPAKSPAPRAGKHAKPATADTSAVTTGPLPVITDASAVTPAATVDSPALLTSALVAALAALAVAKAKTLRLRPAPAGAAATAPRSHRRRKPREQVRTPSARPLQQPMPVEAPRPLVDGVEPVTALRSLRALFPHEPIVIPEATSEFDAFSRPSRKPAEPEQPIRLVWDDDGSTRRLLTDTGPIEIPREPGLYELPNPYSAFHLLGGASGPFPIREEPVLPRPSADARRYDRAPSRSRGRAEGRADLRGRPSLDIQRLEQFTPQDRFAADLPLRGRRHRQAADAQRHEPFAPDAPLRGRRHRPARDTTHHPYDTSRHTPFEQTLIRQEPALAGVSPAADSPGGDAGGRRASRRGRHRA